MNVSKVIPGEYIFELMVWDEKGLNSSAKVKVSIIQEKNIPPKANAGGDRTIVMPDDGQVIINGSSSYDDVGITSYKWTREPESLAAGEILENSSVTPILRLSGLIPGRYVFKLVVTDGQGASSEDVASLMVKSSPHLMDQIELTLNVDINSFTSDQERNLLERLELFLNGEGEQVKVVKLRLEAETHLRR